MLLTVTELVSSSRRKLCVCSAEPHLVSELQVQSIMHLFEEFSVCEVTTSHIPALLVLVSAEANRAPLLFGHSNPSQLFVYGSIMSQAISSLCSACANPPPPRLESRGRGSAKVPLCASGPGPHGL